jgi:hypothetical protein
MTFPSAPELLGGLHPLHPYRGAFSLACENRRGSITLPMLEEFLQVQQQDEACSWSIASVPGQFTGPTATVLSARRHSKRSSHLLRTVQEVRVSAISYRAPILLRLPAPASPPAPPTERGKAGGFSHGGAVGAMTLMRG